jgi:acyl-CoA synthetase (AMP-forming)/AMP-acid ligase II/acyl carrier protein
MTYAMLWACARDTVHTLRSVGVSRSDRVALVLPDGPEAAAASISVAVGAVCAPLNPSFTADEWRRYFDELKLAALVTRADLNSASLKIARARGIPILEPSRPPHIAHGLFSISGPAAPRVNYDDFSTGTDDAFILLTSGTTSRPKTVPLTHASVCLSAYNVGAAIALEPQDRLLSVLPLFHGHGLISGVIATLAVGSSVICTPGFDAAAFLGWLKEFQPTWYTAVPAIHQAALSASERDKESARRSSLRLIRSASSTLPAKVLRGLESLFRVPVIDTFGMTEAATQIAANPLHRRKLGSVGRSAGAEIVILNSEGRRLSAGKRGEVALRGPTITRGYDNDAAATREAFRDGWFRTGDLGYLDKEGYLFIGGRIKEVINRGGQKVAPGEVEEALLSHPDVVDAAAFAVPHTRLGSDVAAAVVLRQSANVGEQNLRDFVRKRLARFKVPGQIRFVPQIPKGAGGKIKRVELATALSQILPTARRRRGGKMVAPGGDLTQQIAKAWADLLDVDWIDVDQDVLALGADSIVVAQVILRLHERFGVDLTFKDIFSAPTPAALAVRLQKSNRRSGPLSSNPHDRRTDVGQVKRGGPQSVTIAQERMLQIERVVPGLPQFNRPFAYRLKGSLNIAALKRSLVEVVRRHDSLRTGFAWRDGSPAALITASAKVKLSLIVDDIGAEMPAGNSRTKELLRRKAALAAERDSLKPFDISRGPLLRAHLLRLAADDHVLLLVVHHIVIDGWSMVVLMEEVAKLYGAYAGGRQIQLPEPALQFPDFARWQQSWSTSGAAERQFAFWRRRLRKAAPLFAAPNSELDNELDTPVIQERLHITNDMHICLTDLTRRRGVTLFMTLLAAFKAMLLLRTGRKDICVATAMANRSQGGTERAIGPFANTAIIRTRIDADQTFQEVLDCVREAVLDAYARQELPYDIVAARLANEGDVDPDVLIQAYFVIHPAFRRRMTLSGVTVRPFRYQDNQLVMPTDRVRLAMTLNETPSGIGGACSYKSGLFGSNAAPHLMTDYRSILSKAATHPKTLLRQLVGH